jgi:hypothetical protein
MFDFKSVSHILISRTEQRNAMRCISLFTLIAQFSRRSHRATNCVPMLPGRVRALCGNTSENKYAVMRTSAEEDYTYIPRLCCCTSIISAVLFWRLSHSLQSLHAMKNGKNYDISFHIFSYSSLHLHFHLTRHCTKYEMMFLKGEEQVKVNNILQTKLQNA